MNRRILNTIIATGLSLSAAMASTLNSGNADVYYSGPGALTRVSNVDCQSNPVPYCWGAVNAPWLSNQDSGAGGTNLNEPVGLVGTFYERFHVDSYSTGTLALGGDDSALAGFINLNEPGAGIPVLAEASFYRPVTSTFSLNAGDYLLFVQLWNEHSWPNNNAGNFTGSAWDGTVTPTPEPATIAATLGGLGLLFWRKRS